ncbi:hypothetical protein ACOSP6_00010 [Tenacibaculum sp. MEBiC06402]|uniref:hypothetical protein n=1 Tax=unclassified Tenacibaculum TaxID=2635139 RepID=UPI003B9B9DEE
MKKIIILLLFYSFNSIAQNNRSQIVLDENIAFSKRIDSLIIASESIQYNGTEIIRSISEGPISLTEKITYDDGSSEKESTVGSGGFSRYVYRAKETNELIKVQHNSTVHYEKDSLSANSERLEISVYYKSQKPFLTKIIENHYTSSRVISSNRYYLNLPKDINDFYDTYYSNSKLKDIIFNVLELLKEIQTENK